MIAFARATQKQALSRQEVFLAMLPTIKEIARYAFRARRAEMREELIQEVIANAYIAYTRLVALGKQNVAYPTPLARYAIRQVCSGRRVGGRLNVRDVLSPSARGRVTLERLDQLNGEGVWKEAIVEDRKAGPAETAAARIDMADWLRSLPRRARRIARVLANGESTSGAAKNFGVTLGRISQYRRELETSWRQFQGEAAVQS